MNLDVGQTKTLPRNYAAAVRNSKVKEEERKKKLWKIKEKKKKENQTKAQAYRDYMIEHEVVLQRRICPKLCTLKTKKMVLGI